MLSDASNDTGPLLRHLLLRCDFCKIMLGFIVNIARGRFALLFLGLALAR